MRVLPWAAITLAACALSGPADAQNATYEYDTAGRITSAFQRGVAIQYTYDNNGNLLSKTSCAGACFINGECFAEADDDPANTCRTCASAIRALAWSDKADGAPCPGGTCVLGVCTQNGGDTGPDAGALDGSIDSGIPGLDSGIPGTDGGATTDGGTGSDAGTANLDEGCGCSTSSTHSRGGAWAMALSLLLLVRIRRLRGLLPLVLLTLCLPWSARASEVCVQPGQGCDYTSISEAFSNASPNETIIVRPGIYSESGLTKPSSVTLRAKRVSSPPTVVIDGGQAGRIMQASGGLIEGITFRNGDEPVGDGGAIAGGNLTISHCRFEMNVAQTNGGAIGNQSGAPITITDSYFVGNRANAGLGGAVFQNGPLVVLRSTFLDNRSTRSLGASGGAIRSNHDVTIRDSNFTDNRAQGNNAGFGGAIDVTNDGGRRCQISNSNFTMNQATGGQANGGAIRAPGCRTTIEGGSMTGNQAMATGSNGRGGALYINPHPTFETRVSASVSGNIASNEGGGVYCQSNSNDIAIFGMVGGNTPNDVINCRVCSAGQTEACQTGEPGVCDAGTRGCAGGLWGPCLPDTPPTLAEDLCTDLLDNDCDGLEDAADTSCQSVGKTITQDDTGDSSLTSNDPVNTLTGELIEEPPAELVLRGPMPLRFRRYYASGLLDAGVTGSMGNNWRHSFEWSLVDNTTTVEVTTNKGGRVVFTDVAGTWVLTGSNSGTAWTLTESGADFRLGDPRSGRVFTFDGAGFLVSIEDGKGNVLGLSYVGSDLAQVADGLGRTLAFSADASGRLLSVIDNGGRSLSFTYSGNELATAVNARGGTTTYAVTGVGKMASITRPNGTVRYTQTWDGSDRVQTQADAFGNTFSFGYQGAPGDTTITDPSGNTRVHSYNLRGEAVGVSSEDGLNYMMAYDDDGHRAQIDDRLGDQTRYAYHPESGKLAAIYHADGSTTTYHYGARFQSDMTFYELRTVTYRDGAEAHFDYDSAGNLIRRVDRRGQEWQLAYNERGQLVSMTNPEGASTTTLYNADGTAASFADEAGNTRSFSYDAVFRVTQVDFDDGSSLQISYDDEDRILGLTDRRGASATLVYDDNGNLTSATDRSGATTDITYDAMDRPLSVTDAEGGTTSYTYDAFGRIATVTDRAGSTTAASYDARGQLTQLLDGAGEAWSIRYDVEAVLNAVQDPAGRTTAAETDRLGRTTAVISATGARTEVSLDGMGRIVRHVNPSGEVVAREVDAAGRTSTVDRSGLTVSLARDSEGRWTQAMDPNGNAWRRTFDSRGRLTSRVDPLGRAVTYGHDTNNRIVSAQLPGGQLTFTRDANGNITEKSFAGGPTLSFAYDAADRVVGAGGLTLSRNSNGRVVETNGLLLTRDPADRIETVVLGPGRAVNYAYDARGLLISVTDWMGGVTSFSYDDAGRPIGMARPNAVDDAYTWDDDGRLIAIDSGATSNISLTRDPTGRVISADRNLPSAGPTAAPARVALTYDAASQVASFTYDASGRRLGDGTQTYAWDAAGRLTQVSGPSDVVFTYDDVGHLTARTEGGTTREYVQNYALGRPSVSVVREGGNDLRYYVHRPNGDLLYSVEADGTRRYYHYDERGNTQYLTDDTQMVVGSYAYGPYGELLSESGSVDNPFTWQGQVGAMRAPAGLYQLRARYYDSESARFISVDPVQSVGVKSINPYGYANQNPMRFIDPSGASSVESDPIWGGYAMMSAMARKRARKSSGREAVDKHADIPRDPDCDEKVRREMIRGRSEVRHVLSGLQNDSNLRTPVRNLFLDTSLSPEILPGRPQIAVVAVDAPGVIGRQIARANRKIGGFLSDQELREIEYLCGRAGRGGHTTLREVVPGVGVLPPQAPLRPDERRRLSIPLDVAPDPDDESVINELGSIVVIA